MLDVNVPAISGELLVKALHRQHTAVCVVSYSGLDAGTLQGLAKSAEADGWIQKGTPMEDVVRRIRRLCPSPPHPPR